MKFPTKFFLIVFCSFNVYASDVEFDSIKSILPNGYDLLFAYTLTSGNSRHVFIGDTKTKTVRQLTNDSLFSSNPQSIRLQYVTFTPDGSRLTFYNASNMTVYTINVDGSNLRPIACGFRSSSTWQHPEDKSDWVLLIREELDKLGPIYRMNLDSREMVLLWDKSPVGKFELECWSGLSKDGSKLACNFPWPSKGIASVPNGTLINLSPGCWVGMSNDDKVIHISTHDKFTFSDLNGKTIFDEKANLYFKCGPNGTDAWAYSMLRPSNIPDYITFFIDDHWTQNKGLAIASISKRKIAHILSQCDLGTAFIYPSVSPLKTNFPIICKVDDITTRFGNKISIPVYTRFAESLSSNNLPANLTISKINENFFSINGSIPSNDSLSIILTALNSNGSFKDTFNINAIDSSYSLSYFIKYEKESSIGSFFYKLYSECSDTSFKNIPVNYSWKELSNNSAQIHSSSSPITCIRFPKMGTYIFQLTVTDGLFSSVNKCSVSVMNSLPFKIISPSKGQVLTPGQNTAISWQLDPPASVVIECKYGNLKEWKSLFSEGKGGNNKIENIFWTVPLNAPSNNNYKIRIYPYGEKEKAIASDSFSIIKTEIENQSIKLPFYNISTCQKSQKEIIFSNLNTNSSELSGQLFSINGVLIKSFKLFLKPNEFYKVNINSPGIYILNYCVNNYSNCNKLIFR